MKSLESFDSNVVLIAGGRDKNGDFAALIPYVRDRVKKIVVIGEASGKIEDALGKTVPVERAVTLWDAVSLAFAGAEHGGTVLFSPACASFDMFRDFEDRGRQFKQITKELMRDQS
jgi:UDP-N-acetylmuramoylalanine--D-glutamate ligase